jgi:hypothetical protein
MGPEGRVLSLSAVAGRNRKCALGKNRHVRAEVVNLSESTLNYSRTPPLSIKKSISSHGNLLQKLQQIYNSDEEIFIFRFLL